MLAPLARIIYNLIFGENYNKQPYLSNATNTDPQIRNPRRLQNWFKYNILSKAQLSNIVLSITVPGNTGIEVGDVVNLHIPQSSELPELSKKLICYMIISTSGKILRACPKYK